MTLGPTTPDHRLPAYRPAQQPKAAPCQEACAVSGDVRGWIGVVAQRRRLGLDDAGAYERAWHTIVDVNPFPAVLGRICPHPCQVGCNRNEKDEPVAINALERFLGDWAIDRGLALDGPAKPTTAVSVGVVGAGPSGLSFAYQMARRGYSVTVYDRRRQAGGMLRYGVPDYRLPPSILDAEIGRIVDLGVSLELGVSIGRDVDIDTLVERHAALYLAIGAQRGRSLDIPGEAGSGVLTGVDYLNAVNSGQSVDLGKRVTVIGGGNTAVDAARAARRGGAEVTILYRRSRNEMPASDAEIEEALAEDVAIRFLRSPVAIKRTHGEVTAIEVERMELGAPDSTGRQRPVPIPGSVHDIVTDSIIVAVAQLPDWHGIQGVGRIEEPGSLREVAAGVWLGGDATSPGIAGVAIAHGRLAADEIHAALEGRTAPPLTESTPIPARRVKLDSRPFMAAAERARVPAAVAITQPDLEVNVGIDEAQFLAEVERCFSCGMCFGCGHCAMYCTVGAFSAVEAEAPGNYYAMDLGPCLECGKCIEVCPTGFLESVIDPVWEV